MIGADLLAGATFFRGVRETVAGKDARTAGQAAVEQRIRGLSELDVFAAPIKRGDALTTSSRTTSTAYPSTSGRWPRLVRDIPEGKERPSSDRR